MSVLKDGAKQLGLKLTEKNVRDFTSLASLLEIRNKEFNLTAIKNMQEVESKHFLDSLSILAAMDIPQKAKVLDVGTGAGFPALPLMICRPDLQLTALDSTEKKLVFVREAAAKIGAKISILYTRAEVLSHAPSYRESFDYVVSRGVSNMANLAEICLPFVKLGGAFVAYKGPAVEDECEQAAHSIKLMGGQLEKIVSYTLPDVEGDRFLAIIRKVDKTPPLYPRSWSAIKRS